MLYYNTNMYHNGREGEGSMGGRERVNGREGGRGVNGREGEGSMGGRGVNGREGEGQWEGGRGSMGRRGRGQWEGVRGVVHVQLNMCTFQFMYVVTACCVEESDCMLCRRE